MTESFEQLTQAAPGRFAGLARDYTVADVKLGHRMGPWTASFGVANLFDRKYYAYAVRSQFVADRFNAYPLPERSFWVGLEYSGL